MFTIHLKDGFYLLRDSLHAAAGYEHGDQPFYTLAMVREIISGHGFKPASKKDLESMAEVILSPRVQEEIKGCLDKIYRGYVMRYYSHDVFEVYSSTSCLNMRLRKIIEAPVHLVTGRQVENYTFYTRSYFLVKIDQGETEEEKKDKENRIKKEKEEEEERKKRSREIDEAQTSVLLQLGKWW